MSLLSLALSLLSPFSLSEEGVGACSTHSKIKYKMIRIGVATKRPTKIDDIIDTPVDYLKTDLEGADAEAILGAKEVISKYRPTIVTDENDHLIVKILNNLGYKKHQHAQHFCKDAIFFPEELTNKEVVKYDRNLS